MCLCNSQPEISNSDLPDAVLEKQEGLCHEEAADAVVMVLNTLRSIRLNAAWDIPDQVTYHTSCPLQ